MFKNKMFYEYQLLMAMFVFLVNRVWFTFHVILLAL